MACTFPRSGIDGAVPIAQQVLFSFFVFLFFFGKWGRRVYRGTKVLGYGRGRDNTTAKDRSRAGSKGADSILG